MKNNLIKHIKNNEKACAFCTVAVGAVALSWLIICTITWIVENNNNQTGKLTDFDKPKVNVYTGKPFTKYGTVGIDVTGDNEADFSYAVRKWDNDIKVGDTVKLSSPFLLKPLTPAFFKKMEKVR